MIDYTIARKNGSGAISWSEEQVRYIKQEYIIKDRTIKELAREFSVQPASIRTLLRREKVEITNKKIRNYPRNSNYFEDIDSSEKAYWLGMMMSDGMVGKDRTISLGLKDEDHIKKFQQAIGATNNKIQYQVDTRWSKPCEFYRLSFKDLKMSQDLKKLGVIPNKTYLGFSFPNISEKYYWDFIRGYYDGDGGLCFTQNRYQLSIVGQKDFLIKIREIFDKNNISIQQNSVSKITYELKIGGQKDVKRILMSMYENSTENTRLERKYKLALKVIN